MAVTWAEVRDKALQAGKVTEEGIARAKDQLLATYYATKAQKKGGRSDA